MDAMITERMTRAREKDEHSLRLFNQLRERRGSSVRMGLSHGHTYPDIYGPGCVFTYRGCSQRAALRTFRVDPAKRAFVIAH
jgi:hypothetical protein